MSLEILTRQYWIIYKVATQYSKKVEDVVQLCEKRAQVEALYSTKMRQIAEQKTSIEGGTLLFGLEAYQVEALKKAEQSRILSENIISELVEMVRSTLQEQGEIEKSYNAQITQLQKQWESIQKLLRKRKDDFSKAHSRVEKLLFELEEMRKKELLETQSGIQKNIQLATDLRNHEEAREAYKEIVQYTQKFEEQFLASVKYITDALKAVIVKKINLVKTALQHHFALLSIEDKFQATIEEINGELDLAHLLEELTPIEEPFEKTPFEKIESGWDKLFELYQKYYFNNENPIYYSTLVEETKEQILQEDDKEFQEIYQLFQTYCTKVLKDGLNPEKSLIRQIEDIVTKPKGRLAFSRALGSTPPPFKFSGDSLKHLQILSCKFLNLAVKAEEFELILRFLEASKEISISENNSLLLSVRTHNSWKNFSVWHTSLKQAISIARRSLLMSDFSSHSEVEREKREKSALFEVIMNQLKLMGELNVNKEETRLFVMEYCKSCKLSISQIDIISELLGSSLSPKQIIQERFSPSKINSFEDSAKSSEEEKMKSETPKADSARLISEPIRPLGKTKSELLVHKIQKSEAESSKPAEHKVEITPRRMAEIRKEDKKVHKIISKSARPILK